MHRNGIVLSVVALLVLGGLGACGTVPTPTVPTEGGPVVLMIAGKVDNELSLTKADIQGRDMVTVTTRHPQQGEDDYEGVRLNDLLEEAGIQSGATLLLVTSARGTAAEVPLTDVRACLECLISFCESGNLRLVMPGMPAEAWVGQVISIKVQ